MFIIGLYIGVGLSLLLLIFKALRFTNLIYSYENNNVLFILYFSKLKKKKEHVLQY